MKPGTKRWAIAVETLEFYSEPEDYTTRNPCPDCAGTSDFDRKAYPYVEGAAKEALGLIKELMNPETRTGEVGEEQ